MTDDSTRNWLVAAVRRRPITAALLLLLLLAALLLVWLRPDSVELLLLPLLLALVALTLIATVGRSAPGAPVAALSAAEQANASAPGRLVCVAGSQDAYLQDYYGDWRLVPDADTLAYLQLVLNAADPLHELDPSALAGRRGELFPSIRTYRRPLTPAEQELADLRLALSRSLLVEARFQPDASPQRIAIRLRNQGDRPLSVKKLRFQHHDLPEAALALTHPRDQYTSVIPFDPAAAELLPGGELDAALELAQLWQPADIDRLRGHWGFLVIDLEVDGQAVDGLLVQI